MIDIGYVERTLHQLPNSMIEVVKSKSTPFDVINNVKSAFKQKIILLEINKVQSVSNHPKLIVIVANYSVLILRLLDA